jgi:hypothetical protein
VRTETKYIIFPHNLNGHPGAVYGDIVAAEHGRTKGAKPKFEFSPKFHNLIDQKFNECRRISDYIKTIVALYEQEVLHDKTNQFSLSRTPNYLVDGTKTNDYGQISFFQQDKLKTPHQTMLRWLRDMLNQAELSKLQNGDKIIYTYSADSDQILPLSTEIKKSNFQQGLLRLNIIS